MAITNALKQSESNISTIFQITASPHPSSNITSGSPLPSSYLGMPALPATLATSNLSSSSGVLLLSDSGYKEQSLVYNIKCNILRVVGTVSPLTLANTEGVLTRNAFNIKSQRLVNLLFSEMLSGVKNNNSYEEEPEMEFIFDAKINKLISLIVRNLAGHDPRKFLDLTVFRPYRITAQNVLVLPHP